MRRHPPGGPDTWRRTNHRGEPVTLLEGPAFALGAAASVLAAPGLPARHRLAGVLAAVSAGALGGYDDLAGSGDNRGLRGHLGALRSGQVTTGAVKVLGLGATGLACAALVRRWPVDVVLGGAVIAGTANLINLLDLRPGRAVKAGILIAAPTVLAPGSGGDLVAGPLGAAAGVVADDLGERSMLGDAGANALGALIGLGAISGATRAGLLLRLAALVGLTLASERVSFSAVIASTPGLRELDGLGRRPSPDADAPTGSQQA
jgi:UDP-N-acetylmuramyl pentapeptide phosphotransferase/UDP-N-acetylglucosamine-1-phosphate transferase